MEKDITTEDFHIITREQFRDAAAHSMADFINSRPDDADLETARIILKIMMLFAGDIEIELFGPDADMEEAKHGND